MWSIMEREDITTSSRRNKARVTVAASHSTVKRGSAVSPFERRVGVHTTGRSPEDRRIGPFRNLHNDRRGKYFPAHPQIIRLFSANHPSQARLWMKDLVVTPGGQGLAMRSSTKRFVQDLL